MRRVVVKSHLEAHVVKQAAEIVLLEASRGRLAAALSVIADADYRGNRSQESEIAHRALVAEGFRQGEPS